MAAFGNWGASLTGAGEAERLQGVRATPNAFRVLGARAAAGRLFEPAGGAPAETKVVVISDALWRRRFGGDAGIVGRSILLNGAAATVLGVLPRDFVLPGAETDVVIPLDLASDPRRAERGSNFLRVVARLGPGVSRERAWADLDAITTRLRAEHPDANAKHASPRVVDLQEEVSGAYRPALVVLFASVGALLLIVCVNVAHLQLVRASSRRAELAIRSALGAPRLRLLGQVLCETLLLAVLGGVVGLLAAAWGRDLLLALAPSRLPLAVRAGVDARVLAFGAGAALLAGVLSGLVPALLASRAGSAALLAAGARAAGGPGGLRAGALLAASEVAICLALLIGGGLLFRSLDRLMQVSPGFAPDRILGARVSLPAGRYGDAEAIAAFCERVSERLGALPGVLGAGAASVLPLSGVNARTDFTIVGRPPASAADVPASQNRWVSDGYFRTMGIPVRAGREFTRWDTARSPGVAVVDETLARRLWPGGGPLGARLRIDSGGPAPREVEIVGVVGDVRHDGLDAPPAGTLYEPLAQAAPEAVPFLANNLSLVVRAGSDPIGLAEAVRREAAGVDREVPTSTARTMDRDAAASVATRRFALTVLQILGAASLLLAVWGVSAVTARMVANRTLEIGIRQALGARRSQVLALVLRRGWGILGAGTAAGLAAAGSSTSLMESLLYGVGTTDPWTFSITPLLLAPFVLLASALPAWRASRRNPAEILRAG